MSELITLADGRPVPRIHDTGATGTITNAWLQLKLATLLAP